MQWKLKLQCMTQLLNLQQLNTDLMFTRRYHDTIERYCDETDTWEIVGEMPTSRSWLSCVSLQLRKDIHMSSCPGTPNDN